MKCALLSAFVLAASLASAQVSVTAKGVTVRSAWTASKTFSFSLTKVDEIGPGTPFESRFTLQVVGGKLRVGRQPATALPQVPGQLHLGEAFPFGPIVWSGKPVAFGQSWTQAATFPGVKDGVKVRWTPTKRHASGCTEFRADLLIDGSRAVIVGRGSLLLENATGLPRTWNWDEQMTTYATTSAYSGTINRRRISLKRV